MKRLKKTVSIWLLVVLLICPSMVQAAAVPQISAPGAIVIDMDTNEILYEKAKDTPRSVASMTKVMTALLAYDAVAEGKLTMDSQIPVSANAKLIIPNDPCGQYVPYPDEARLGDLLAIYLIVSSSPAGTAIAEYLGGDEATFVTMMNERAKELGIDAVYADANGLKPNRVTPLAQAKLVRHFVRTYPEVLEITSQPTVTFYGRTYPGTNKFLLGDRGLTGVDGFKSGTMPFAGFCFSITCRQNGHYMVSVVAGSSSNATRYSDTVKIQQYAFARRAELDRAKGADPVAVKPAPEETKTPEKPKTPDINATSPWAMEWMERGDKLGLDTYRDLKREAYCGQEPLTRGEFAALVMRGLKPERGHCVETFKDVPTEHPFAQDIVQAVAAGVVQGGENGLFRPDDLVSRQEMALMLTRLFSWEERTPHNHFTDKDMLSHVFSEAVGRMSEAGLMQGDENGRFNPLDSTTREMAMKTVITCYDREQRGDLTLRPQEEKPLGCRR